LETVLKGFLVFDQIFDFQVGFVPILDSEVFAEEDVVSVVGSDVLDEADFFLGIVLQNFEIAVLDIFVSIFLEFSSDCMEFWVIVVHFVYH
jgi:hypothetical protein